MHRSLWWMNGQGRAECDGVGCQLKAVPRLPGVSIVEIEYLPRVKQRMLCPDEGGESWRNMTDDECHLADQMLIRMRDSAQQVFA